MYCMESKFKPGDKVFYIYNYDNEETMQFHIVIDKERAKIFYTGTEERNTCSSTPEQINQLSQSQYKCDAVFIVDLGNSNKSIGWMPENQLFLFTKAAEILYGQE